MHETLLSEWRLLSPQHRQDVFEEIYRTLPDHFDWMLLAKEAAINLNEREIEQFYTWFRHYRKTGELS